MEKPTTGSRRRARRALAAGLVVAVAALVAVSEPVSNAEPASDVDLIQPLPVIVPTPSSWAPPTPFPYDQTISRVTPADIAAMAELCQWYNAQYDVLNDQISRLQFNRINDLGQDWDYSINGVQQQVDVVVGNIDQSLSFMAPRVHSLTQDRNFAGDINFPVYKGDAFYGLWQQLSNVSNGIKAHQPGWFTGPSQLRAKKWGSEINRSHVCDQ